MITEAKFIARIAALRKSCGVHGWDHYGAAPLTRAHCEVVERRVRALVARGIPWPHAYPTDPGGVSIEWTFGPWEISVDIDPGEIECDATKVIGDNIEGPAFMLAACVSDDEFAYAIVGMLAATGNDAGSRLVGHS